jgi:hypothetical protein
MKSRYRAIGNATKAQKEYHDRACDLGCVVCRYRIAKGLQDRQPNQNQLHHRNIGDLHGQKQLGHDSVVSLCAWHHDGVPIMGWTMERMHDVYGPSYKEHAREFRVWTADVIGGRGTEAWQRYQDELLEGRNAA